MNDQENLLSVAIEIRELLKLLAEPAMAQRDDKFRAIIRQTVGRSSAKQKATMRMNGSLTQKEIAAATGIDPSDLSKLVRVFRGSELLADGEKPKLAIWLPSNFFETGESK